MAPYFHKLTCRQILQFSRVFIAELSHKITRVWLSGFPHFLHFLSVFFKFPTCWKKYANSRSGQPPFPFLLFCFYSNPWSSCSVVHLHVSSSVESKSAKVKVLARLHVRCATASVSHRYGLFKRTCGAHAPIDVRHTCCNAHREKAGDDMGREFFFYLRNYQKVCELARNFN